MDALPGGGDYQELRVGKALKVVASVAVAVGIAVLAAPTGGLSIALAGALSVSTAVASAIIATGLSLAAGLAFKALGLTQGAPKARAAGPPTVFRQSVSDSFIVYGKRRVGGLMVFFHPRKSGDDHYRYFVIAVAGHRCQGVTKWFLNDEEVTVDGAGLVTTGKYANAAWLWFQRGLDAETANATFVAECGGKWTADHKGNGIAAIYAKFKLTDDVVEAGMPNITAEILGKDDIYDPRDGTEKCTNNAALVFYDWMQIPREEGGFGAYADEIPDDDWISAQANVCDEIVDGEARYALDGVIVTGAPPNEIRDVMVVNCAGTFAYSGGKFLMRPGYYVPVSVTLSEADLAGPIAVDAFLAGDQTATEVQGTFIDPANGYQGMPFPTQTLDPAPADIRQLDLDLAFVTSPRRAARIARIMLNRAQAEKTVTWPMNIMGLKVQAMDTVQLDTSRYGLSNYAFTVAHWGLSSDYNVVLTLREENPEIYEAPSVTVTATPELDKAEMVRTVADIQGLFRDTYPVGLTMTGNDAGEIIISDHAHDWPGIGQVAVTGTTLTGLTLSTTYYPYADFDEVGDATPTFGATTVYADAINSAAHPRRMYLYQSVTLPGAGGGSSGGTGFGGGYGGGGAIP